MSTSLDYATMLSFENQASVERLCAQALSSEFQDFWGAHQTLKFRYHQVLCEIGEPPLPCPEAVAKAREIDEICKSHPDLSPVGKMRVVAKMLDF